MNFLARLVLASALFASLHVSAQTPAPVLRELVRKPLHAAQEALNAGQPEAAIGLAREALAAGSLSEGEQYLSLQMLALAGSRAKEWAVAAQANESLLKLSGITATQRLAAQESLMQASQQGKEYARLVAVAREYIASGGSNTQVPLVMLQALAVQGQHTQVVQEVRERVVRNTQAQRKTPEDQLKLAAQSCSQLKDSVCSLDMLRQLSLQTLKSEYLADFASRLMGMSNFNARYELDLYRVLEKTAALEDASDYTRMADLALKAGLPVEALRAINSGYKDGVLGKGSESSTHEKLRDTATAKTREDEAQFAAIEKAAKDGNSLSSLADVYLSQQNWSKAAQTYEKALAAGGLRRELDTKLHWAISLVQAGQTKAAIDVLGQFQTDATVNEIAMLWRAIAQSP